MLHRRAVYAKMKHPPSPILFSRGSKMRTPFLTTSSAIFILLIADAQPMSNKKSQTSQKNSIFPAKNAFARRKATLPAKNFFAKAKCHRFHAMCAQKKAVVDATALKFAANYLNRLDYGLRFLSNAKAPRPRRHIVAGSGTQIVSITSSSM